MLGLTSYLLFLATLTIVMRLATPSRRELETANAAAAVLSARLH